MRYVQINSFYNGSTGTIMRNLHKELKEQGDDSYIFWGRRHETISDHEACCASKLGVYAHGILSRLTDRVGFYSKRDTRRLLERLEAIDPDVVHLHNVHGYYINIEMLFEWLANHRCQVKWTLHDCWAFTGHCSHFTYVGCERWRDGCHDCPQKREYPKSLLANASERNFHDKKRLFNLVPKERMTLITPSRWLAELLKDSFLAEYPVEVRYNTVDTDIFKPTPSDFRERYGLEDKLVILGVASPWTERKGLDDFLYLANELDARYAIVLVGLEQRQIDSITSAKNILPDDSLLGDLTRVFLRFIDGDSDVARKAHVASKQKAQLLQIKASDPSMLESLKSRVAERDKGVKLVLFERTDSAQQLASIYTAADVFFNPTREDNYPTVNLEAQACGTPVITYDTGGCREGLYLEESECLSIYG